MNLPTRQMLMGMTLGAACATALAMIGPGYVLEAFADEAPAGFDTGNLVRFDDRDYEVSYADWVSTEPLSTTRITKIEGGRVSYVDVTTTATGTYSTDGLTSPHVQYPGIEVEPAATRRFSFSSWSGGQWTRFSTFRGNSFISIGTGGTRIATFR